MKKGKSLFENVRMHLDEDGFTLIGDDFAGITFSFDEVSEPFLDTTYLDYEIYQWKMESIKKHIEFLQFLQRKLENSLAELCAGDEP